MHSHRQLAHKHILREASACLLVLQRWAYQSLDEWDEQRSMALTLFLYQSNAEEVSPEATIQYHVILKQKIITEDIRGCNDCIGITILWK